MLIHEHTMDISDHHLLEICSQQFSSKLSTVAIVQKTNNKHKKAVFHLLETLSNYFILLYQIYSVS